MLSFKQFLESLSDDNRSYIDHKQLKILPGRDVMSNVLEPGKNHLEIPIENPLHRKINDHLAKKPIMDQERNIVGHWRVDEDGRNVVHPIDHDKTRPITSMIKDNPELLDEYQKSLSLSGDNIPAAEGWNGVGKKIRWGVPNLVGSNKKIVISRHRYAIEGMSSDDKPWESCAKLGYGIHAAKNLDNHVKSGGAVAYLVDKDEKNPNDPETAEGRVALYPFISRRGHVVLRASPKRYGADDGMGSFHKTVAAWAEKEFPLVDDEYKLHPGVYHMDHKPNQRILLNKAKYGGELHSRIDSGDVTLKDLIAAHSGGYLGDDHIKKLVDDPEHHAKLIALHEKVGINRSILDTLARRNPGIHSNLARILKSGVGNSVIKILAKNPEFHRHILDYLSKGNSIGSCADELMTNKNRKKILLGLSNGATLSSNLIRHFIDTGESSKVVQGIKNGSYVNDSIIDELVKDPKHHEELANAFAVGRNITNAQLSRMIGNNAFVNSRIAETYKNGRLTSELVKKLYNKGDKNVDYHLLNGHLAGIPLDSSIYNGILRKWKDDHDIQNMASNLFMGGHPVGHSIMKKIAQGKNSQAQINLIKGHNDGKILDDDILEELSKNPSGEHATEILYGAKKGIKYPFKVLRGIALSENPFAHNELMNILSLDDSSHRRLINIIAGHEKSHDAHRNIINKHFKYGGLSSALRIISQHHNPVAATSIIDYYLKGYKVPKDIIYNISHNASLYGRKKLLIADKLDNAAKDKFVKDYAHSEPNWESEMAKLWMNGHIWQG